SRLNARARVVQADDSGNVEGTGEDRRVVRPAAGVGPEAADLGPVHLCRDRGRQLVGYEHGRLVELAQQITGGRDALPQVHPETADQVRHVALALAQVRIGDVV